MVGEGGVRRGAGDADLTGLSWRVALGRGGVGLNGVAPGLDEGVAVLAGWYGCGLVVLLLLRDGV